MSQRIADRLIKARDLLRARGWTQGIAVDPDTGELCLIGAVELACGGDPRDELSRPPADEPFCTIALCRALEARAYDSDPVEWNDEPGRTMAEVCDLLLDAAEREAEQS